MNANATLEGRRDFGSGLALFTVLPDAAVAFEAGQHTTVAVASSAGWLRRPLSAASPPAERTIDFLVRRSSRRDDAFIESLFALAPRARLAAGPGFSGDVTIERTTGADDRRARVFVAAGTGIAPFLSMVRALGDDGRTVVLHGARDPQEFTAHETFEDILGDRYVRVLSGGDPAWKGLRGRVETLFVEERIDVVERAAGLGRGRLHPSRAVVYVCGFRETIAQTVRRLLGRGFVPAGSAARRALGVPADAEPSVFFEYYEREPLFGDLP